MRPFVFWNARAWFYALLIASCGNGPASAAPSLDTDASLNAAAPWISDGQLRAAAVDRSTRNFYEINGWRAVWSDAAATAFRRSLDGRARHGLDHLVFLDRDQASKTAAQREVALTRAALRYASALAFGVTDPSELHAIYTIPKPQPDLDRQLALALASMNLEDWLAGLAPQDKDYDRLAQAYLQARQATGTANSTRISPGIIRVGDADERVPAIARQLIDADYLAAHASSDWPLDVPPASAGTTLYTQRIADAVERLQRDYGIAADGTVGPDTLEVLNLRPGDRAQALAVAMERLRWLSRTPPRTRIDVNTAAARLFYYRDGELVDTRRVIVGEPGKETPQLNAPIFRLVASPTWTIPKSIQHGELAGVGSGYLRRHRMVRRGGWIVQKSGPSNALGLVKFDMHDDQAIYLHDTPARALFARSERHLSHGCVRVEDALGFARHLAQDQGVADQWRRARAAGEQRFVSLPQPIPVRLLYQNVFIDRDGVVAFRTDPYGWNPPIAKALGFDRIANSRAHTKAVDIGP